VEIIVGFSNTASCWYSKSLGIFEGQNQSVLLELDKKNLTGVIVWNVNKSVILIDRGL